MNGISFNSENLGRTPFYFWYGMVVGGSEWEDNQKDSSNSAHKIHTRDDVAGWGYRCKVAIMGYDPHIVDDKSVKNSELAMAEVMLPTTGGGGIGGPINTPTIGNNSFVVGFFKDGISAREPVIMGVIPNVSQSRLEDYEFSEKTRYIASSGYRPGEDKAANDALFGEGPSSSPIAQNGEMARPYTVLLKAQLDDGIRRFSLPETYNCQRKCGGELNSIQAALQQLTSHLGLAKGAIFAQKASDALKNYGAIAANATNIITAYVQKIVQDMRSKVLNKVNATIDGVLDGVIPPNLRSSTVDGTTSSLLDGITCAFNLLLKGLKGIVSNFIKNMIAGAYDIATSTAQALIGCVLTNILGPITSAVGNALAALGGLLGSAISLVGGVLNGLNILLGAFNIFSCKQELQCAGINSWSWLYGDGSTSGCSGGGLPGLFSLFQSFDANVENAKNAVSGAIDAVSNSKSGLEGALGCLNIRQDTQPVLSGPPTVSTSGGGNVPNSGGFAANPVISAKGEILALDIVNGGSGFTSPPNIIIYDSTGNGRGAVAIPIMTSASGTSSGTSGSTKERVFDIDGCGKPKVNAKYPNINQTLSPLSSRFEKDLTSEDNETENLGGGPLQNRPEIKFTPNLLPLEEFPPVSGQSVEKIIVVDSGVGYLQKSDGSTGAGGVKVSNPEDTIVYCGGYNVYPPCSEVQVSEGDSIYIPLGTTGQVFDVEGNLVQSVSGRGPVTPIKIEKTGTLATPCVSREEVIPPVSVVPVGIPRTPEQITTTQTQTEYQVALEIGDVYIEDIGINYSPDDEITIEPANGAELKPKYDEVGRLIDVEIVSPGIGFTESPKIRIYSNTGLNANIIPIFNVIRISDEVIERDIVPSGTKLISVIDCVGIQPPKREFDIIPE